MGFKTFPDFIRWAHDIQEFGETISGYSRKFVIYELTHYGSMTQYAMTESDERFWESEGVLLARNI